MFYSLEGVALNKGLKLKAYNGYILFEICVLITAIFTQIVRASIPEYYNTKGAQRGVRGIAHIVINDWYGNEDTAIEQFSIKMQSQIGNPAAKFYIGVQAYFTLILNVGALGRENN